MLENQKELDEEFLKAVKVNSMDRIITALQSGANLNATTIKGNNALFLAANTNNKELFIALLDATQKGVGINLDNQNSDGNTVLFECTKMQNGDEYIALLLERKANPNITSKSGMSPLIKACGDKNLEIVTLLANDPNIDLNYEISFSNITAYLMAASHAFIDGLKILVDNGVNTKALDAQGRTALMVGLAATITSKKSEKKDQKELVNFLIDIEDDLSYKVPTGMTAFWLASYRGFVEECLHMLEKGVDVNVSHEIGLNGKTTPLHMWCKSSNPILVNGILEAGGKLGVLDDNGNMPEAYGFASPYLQEILLEHNANVNAMYSFKDKSGIENEVPALSLVLRNGEATLPVIEEMLKRGAIPHHKKIKVELHQPILTALVTNNFMIATYLLDYLSEKDINKHYELALGAEKHSLIQLLVSDYKSNNTIDFNETKLKLESIISSGKKKEKKDNIPNDKVEQAQQSLEELAMLELMHNLEKEKVILELLEKGAVLENANENGNTELFMVRKPMFADLLIGAGANSSHLNIEKHNVLYHSMLTGNTNDMILYWKEAFTKKNDPIINNLFYQLAFEDYSNNSFKYKNVKSSIIYYLDNPDVKSLFAHHIKDKPEVHVKELFYQDENGNSPLLVACSKNNDSLANLYLRLNAPVNLANKYGETAIMHALNTENIPLIQALIKAQADLTVTLNGQSILEMAKEVGNNFIVDIIKKALDKPELEKEFNIDEEDLPTPVTNVVKPTSMKI